MVTYPPVPPFVFMWLFPLLPVRLNDRRPTTRMMTVGRYSVWLATSHQTTQGNPKPLLRISICCCSNMYWSYEHKNASLEMSGRAVTLILMHHLTSALLVISILGLEIEIYRAQRSGLPIGIMLIDLDHFKQVNDTYGHDAGDALLQAVAALLGDHVRSGDIVARHGGEEFFMMLPGIPLPPLEQRGEMLRKAIHALQVTHNGQDLGSRSCSIGIAVYPTHGSDSTGLIKAADQALYQAKESGRNCVVIADETVIPLDADVWSLISFDQPSS